MILNRVNFGRVWQASGATNFFGEGYSYHYPLKFIGLSWENSTFVAKTTTLQARKGNMPMKKDGITPKHFKPECIVVNFRKKAVLNAVGLSGPGAEFLFQQGKWQKRTKPFFLSFMSVAETANQRLGELKEFMAMANFYFPQFKAPIGLQLNYSCPNTKHNLEEIGHEIEEGLAIESKYAFPRVPKINALFPVEQAVKIARNINCHAIHVSNTIPWGSVPDKIDWKGIFGTAESPLAKFGGGGLSGAPIFPLVKDWVQTAREIGICKPVNAGGGILSRDEVFELASAGADGISIGSIAMLQPTHMRSVIKTAHDVLK